MKFLIVEHNKRFREYYKKKIRKIYKELFGKDDRPIFEEKEDGITIMKTYKNFEPDYIIMELRLPKMNGYEIAKEIKRESPDAKIIMITGYCEDRTCIKAKKEKLIDIILSKPLDDEELKEYFITTLVQKESQKLLVS